MKHTVEAYDVLIDKLKNENQELCNRLDEESGTNAVIICGLLKYIVKKLDLNSAMEIARFYDLQYPDEQLVRYLVDNFGEKND
jgi:hypothetical protein